MNIRRILAVWAAKAAGFACKKMGRQGVTWAGKIALKIYPPVLKELASEVKKDIFGRMFGFMLPSNSLKLKLSKMNMGGLGRRMMRFLMSKKGVDSLESMRRQALENGVEFIACQMSMDVMGIHPEELLDEVSVGGVATYMAKADESNVNLFI